MQIDRIKYTMKHRKAFRAVEKQLLGHNTMLKDKVLPVIEELGL